MEDIKSRVEVLRKGGLSEREAVNAIKEADADQVKNPDKYLQPYKYVKGDKVRNNKFWDKYGDPDRFMKNVGQEDYKALLNAQKEEQDRLKFMNKKNGK